MHLILTVPSFLFLTMFYILHHRTKTLRVHSSILRKPYMLDSRILKQARLYIHRSFAILYQETILLRRQVLSFLTMVFSMFIIMVFLIT